MSDKKHIDRLFQEKLKDFEATPDQAVWEQIDKKLTQGKKDRRIIPIWWRIAGIAAGIILLITIGNNFLNSDQSNVPEETVVDSEMNDESSSESTKDANDIINIDENNVASETNETDSNSEVFSNPEKDEILDKNSNASERNAVVNNSTRQQSVEEQKDVTSISNQSNSKVEKAIAQNKTDKTQEFNSNDGELMIDKTKANELINSKSTDEESKVVSNSEETQNLEESNEVTNDEDADKLSLTEELTNTEETEEEGLVSDEETQGPRWSVSPNLAPVYFGSFGSGSSIDDEFNSNNKSGEINLSYGVLASYDINNKLSVRAGINQVNLGYSTNDVIVYNNIEPNVGNKPLKNVDLNSNSQNLAFLSASDLNFAEVPSVVANTIQSSIDQELGFIEVPLEVEYKLSEKKLGVSVIGGFSALFLNRNEVYSSLQDDRRLLGEATNINKTSFSANVGLGVDYNVSKRIKLNLEPVLKYQINTFTDTSGNFSPYFIGIYSGISFKF